MLILLVYNSIDAYQIFGFGYVFLTKRTLQCEKKNSILDSSSLSIGFIWFRKILRSLAMRPYS